MAANAGETKVKLWEGICYPENMRDDWQDEIDDILQVPFAYAVHDIDHDQKCKGAAIGAMQYHNDRAPGEHLNPDIDPERTHLNYELHDAEGCYLPRKYAAEVDAKIAANRASGRKVRKDAETQQMRKSGKQLESERASGRPESRSKGVDR